MTNIIKWINIIAVAMISVISVHGQQLKQIQKGTANNQIPVTNGKQYTQVYRDAIPYILDTIGIRDSILAGAMKGAGNSTEVAFFASADSLSSSPLLYWDNNEGRLGFNTQTPEAKMTVNTSDDFSEYPFIMWGSYRNLYVDSAKYITYFDANLPSIKTNANIVINGQDNFPITGVVAGEVQSMLAINSDIGLDPSIVIKGEGDHIKMFNGGDALVSRIYNDGSAQFGVNTNSFVQIGAANLASNHNIKLGPNGVIENKFSTETHPRYRLNSSGLKFSADGTVGSDVNGVMYGVDDSGPVSRAVIKTAPFGPLVERLSIDNAGHVRINSLDTDLTAPSTTGTTKMVVSDNTGLLSFATASGGSVTSIATASPITGGTITTSGTIGINDAGADGSTKGASTYTAADFNSSSGLISLDYTNGQSASGSTKGYLTSTDWNTFNGKFSLPALSSGSVIYSNGSTLVQDNANFNYVSNRLSLGKALSSDYTSPLKLFNNNSGGSNHAVGLEFHDQSTTLNAAIVGMRENTGGNWNGVLSFRTQNSGSPNTAFSSLTEMMNINGNANQIKMSPLAGSGNRLVSATSTGVLSTANLVNVDLVSDYGAALRFANNNAGAGNNRQIGLEFMDGTTNMNGIIIGQRSDVSGNWNGSLLFKTQNNASTPSTLYSTLTDMMELNGNANAVKIHSLAGSGNRMVIAGSTGFLSTQAIPTGTVTSVTASSPLASSGGATPNITIQNATTGQTGALTSTDWNTFNGKMGGSGTDNYITRFNGASAIENSIMYDDGTMIGINNTNPTESLHVGSGHIKVGIVAGSLNKTYYGDGTYVYVGEDVVDDRLGLKGTTMQISIGGSLGSSGQVLTSNGSTTSWQTPAAAGVSSVTASSPLASSGGATPNITIQNASTSTTGALTSTDWNIFNGKFTLPVLSSGSVIYSNGSTLVQDNANFNYISNILGLGKALSSDYTSPLCLWNNNTGSTNRSVGIEFMDKAGTPTLNAAIVGQRNDSGGNWNGMLSFRTQNSGSPNTAFSSLTEMLLLDGNSNTIKMSPLAGSGNRLVTATSTGQLSTGNLVECVLSSDYAAALRFSNTNTGTTYHNVALEFTDRTTTMNAAIIGRRENTGGNWNGSLLFRTQNSGSPNMSATSLTDMMELNGNSNAVRIHSLSGTGNRMVIAGSTGFLSTQAIPTGTVTSVGITNGGGISVSGSPITGSGSITLTAADVSATNELQTLSFNGTTNVLTITPAGNTQDITPYREFGCAVGSVALTNTTETAIDITGSIGTSINTTINDVSNIITITKGSNYEYTVSGYIYNESETTTGVVINLYRTSTLTDWTYATVPAGGFIPFSFTGLSNDGTKSFNVKAQAQNSFTGGYIYINQFKLLVKSLN